MLFRLVPFAALFKLIVEVAVVAVPIESPKTALLNTPF